METADILLYIFFGVTAIQLFFHLFIFTKLSWYKIPEDVVNIQPVSVIISARNEAKNLLENIPLILAQRHPEFEVIVVNDCSYDDTGDVLKAFEGRHKNFRSVTLTETEKFSGGKKFAVTLGIKAASHDLLVFTDADCRPASTQWLSGIANGFSQQVDVVLGYGAYEKRNGFLNKLIRFDAFVIALQYLSFALNGHPYMGVGRNLAYRKSLFFNNKGFASHQSIPSGDDDLFINETAGKRNTAIVIDPESHTVSIPKKTLVQWFGQKKRHLTTARHYKLRDKIFLGLEASSRYLFMALFIGLMVMNSNVYIIGGLFISRLLIQMVNFIGSMHRLDEKDLWPFAPILEIMLMIIYPFIILSNLINKSSQWKRI